MERIWVGRVRVVLSVLLVWMGVGLGGCGLLSALGFGDGDEVIDPKIPVEGKRILVIPFEGPQLPYFEDEEGRQLARAIVQDVQKNRDYTDLKSIFEKDNLEEYITLYFPHISWKKVAEMAQADWVLVGSILSFQTSRPGDVGLLRGSAVVDIRLYDRCKDRFILKERIQTRFPKRETHGVFINSRNIIYEGLIRETAYRIGRLFYSYVAREDPLR